MHILSVHKTSHWQAGTEEQLMIHKPPEHRSKCFLITINVTKESKIGKTFNKWKAYKFWPNATTWASVPLCCQKLTGLYNLCVHKSAFYSLRRHSRENMQGNQRQAAICDSWDILLWKHERKAQNKTQPVWPAIQQIGIRGSQNIKIIINQQYGFGVIHWPLQMKSAKHNHLIAACPFFNKTWRQKEKNVLLLKKKRQNIVQSKSYSYISIRQFYFLLNAQINSAIYT